MDKTESENADVKDASPDQGLVAFYCSLPEKPSTTFQFFNKNDYYIVYGADARFTAKELFKTSTVIKHFTSGAREIEYVNLSKKNFEVLLRDLLLVRQYRVEIFENRGSGKTGDWGLAYKASPGNLIEVEEMLFGNSDMTEAKGVVAIKLKSDAKQLFVGIAYGDAVLQQFFVSEFTDDEQFSNLQALLVQLSIKECLIPSSDPNALYNKVKEVMEKSSVLVTGRKTAEADLLLAMSGLAGVIKYLNLLGNDGNFGHFALSTFCTDHYVRLDSTAISALGILPVAGEVDKTHSLHGLMNRCRTPPGQRLLVQWIKQPLMDINKIDERLNVVEAFVQDTELRQIMFEDYLRKIPDMQRFAKKFLKKKANLQDCYRVYQAVGSLPQLIKSLNQHEGSHSKHLQEIFCVPLQEVEQDFVKFQEMTETTLDLELVDSGQFLVRPDFDVNLNEMRQEMDKIDKLIHAEHRRVAKDLGVEPDKVLKLENCNQNGWCLRVTRKEEKAIRAKKNYIEIDTKQSGVRFQSLKLKELSETYIEYRKNYEEHQKSVVQVIMKIAAGYSDPMQRLSDIIEQLDVLVAFSIAAVTASTMYIRPTLLEKGSGQMFLKQARHPCVEGQDNVDYVPNDADLCRSSRFHIITGPNMGGKSTYIRSVAINVLMAQMGSFVPCDEATISVVDAILTRIGAGDKQLKGVSTFMAEMLETAHILRTATKDSLIIIDELGRGTSTYDGFGLAWAISENIVTNLESFCLFATHFHELTALADEHSAVQNLHVTALTSDDTFTLLYKVKPGICDQSFGIHIAELAHFPKDIVQMAKTKVLELEHFYVKRIFSSDCDEPEAKKIKLEADEKIAHFLQKAKEISSASVSKDHATKKLEGLKSEIQKSQNPYIQNILRGLNRIS